MKSSIDRNGKSRELKRSRRSQSKESSLRLKTWCRSINSNSRVWKKSILRSFHQSQLKNSLSMNRNYVILRRRCLMNEKQWLRNNERNGKTNYNLRSSEWQPLMQKNERIGLNSSIEKLRGLSSFECENERHMRMRLIDWRKELKVRSKQCENTMSRRLRIFERNMSRSSSWSLSNSQNQLIRWDRKSCLKMLNESKRWRKKWRSDSCEKGMRRCRI